MALSLSLPQEKRKNTQDEASDRDMEESETERGKVARRDKQSS